MSFYSSDSSSFAMVDKWSLDGTLFDVCNCETLCPCNYFQDPHGEDCRASVVWKIDKGNFGGTNLDGLKFALVVFSKGNPFKGVESAAFIIDESATTAQRDALMKILGGGAGGLFQMLASLSKENRGVTFAKFDYNNDGKSWSVKAGDALNVKGEFVKPPPGLPFESKPKKVEVYDPLFAPALEKIVGITEYYRANVGGMNYDISGRYSASGRFTYQGP
jgi:hypothetical protein